MTPPVRVHRTPSGSLCFHPSSEAFDLVQELLPDMYAEIDSGHWRPSRGSGWYCEFMSRLSEVIDAEGIDAGRAYAGRVIAAGDCSEAAHDIHRRFSSRPRWWQFWRKMPVGTPCPDSGLLTPAAVGSIEEMRDGGWQSMATAPRDGSEIEIRVLSTEGPRREVWRLHFQWTNEISLPSAAGGRCIAFASQPSWHQQEGGAACGGVLQEDAEQYCQWRHADRNAAIA